MEDVDEEMEEFMNKVQDTTAYANSQFPTDNPEMLDEQPTSSNATNCAAADNTPAAPAESTRSSEDKSHSQPDNGSTDEIYEVFPDNEEGPETHDIATTQFSDGYCIGETLLAVTLEWGLNDEHPSFQTTIAGVKYRITQYINLNKLETKTKKLFNMVPDQTPTLFGYRHYFALLNTYDSRGYFGRCPLVYTPTEEEASQGIVSNCVEYVLMDILETRCWKERYDIAVYITAQKEVQIVEDGLKWMRDQRLECRPDLLFEIDETEQ